MDLKARIYIAGHKGRVGSAIMRALQRSGYSNFIFRNSSELDLVDQTATQQFFKEAKPEYVFLAAGSSLKGQSDLAKYEKARKLKVSRLQNTTDE